MFNKASSNSYNQVRLTGYTRLIDPLPGSTVPYIAPCYSPFTQCAYFAPLYKNAIWEYNPVTGEQIEYFFDADKAFPGFTPITAQYSFSLTSDNIGNIYIIPFYSPTVIKFNVITKTFSYYAGFTGGIGKYYGGCFANDGWIYFFPMATDRVLRFNPVTEILSYFGSAVGVSTHYLGAYASNNCIYQVPYPNPLTTIRKINLTTGAVTLIPGIDSGVYSNISHTLDGRLVLTNSFTSNNWHILDPTDDSIQTFPGAVISKGITLGLKPAPNGKMYTFVSDAGLLEINLQTNKMKILDTSPFQPSLAHQGSTSTPQGILFLANSSTFRNKMSTITNIGEYPPEAFQFPVDISTISNSLWTKYQQTF